MKNVQEKEKNSKRMIIIIVCVVLILIIAFVLIFIGRNNSSSDGNLLDSNEPVLTDPEQPSSLASDTEELLNTYKKLDTISVSLDKISFVNSLGIEVGSKMDVYVYSTPKFVGTFEVMEENGVKYITGMKQVLDAIDLEDGEHHLALLLNGEVLGYVSIAISRDHEDNPITEEETSENTEGSDGSLPSVETKEEVVVEIESISYQTKEVQEVNMKRGERKVTTAGVEGSKEVTYKVTYDNSHREIKREKLSEKITKNSVDEVVMVGISDYNINTSTYVEYAGPLCKTLNSIGNMCDETEMNFKAISVDSNPIITCIAETCLTNQVNEHISATWKPNSVLLEATYQGETRYFFTNKAADTQKLTLEDCEKYGLACGSW